MLSVPINNSFLAAFFPWNFWQNPAFPPTLVLAQKKSKCCCILMMYMLLERKSVRITKILNVKIPYNKIFELNSFLNVHETFFLLTTQFFKCKNLDILPFQDQGAPFLFFTSIPIQIPKPFLLPSFAGKPKRVRFSCRPRMHKFRAN